ncbi:MAG: NAD(P)-binding protein [Candidatus Marinimicrobia bacterium]|nr:NAD(P)-binding protein [Candidatus Neomarinimicrobiota bacterium]
MKENYDVIVIGSGIGGLSAAGLTAKTGKCVLVVDQRPEPGGVMALNGMELSLISSKPLRLLIV